MKKTKLTSDRIATLGSRMMKFAPKWSERTKLGDLPYEVLKDSGLAVGDIRDAGASLVSQADGPEVVTRKKVKG